VDTLGGAGRAGGGAWEAGLRGCWPAGLCCLPSAAAHIVPGPAINEPQMDTHVAATMLVCVVVRGLRDAALVAVCAK